MGKLSLDIDGIFEFIDLMNLDNGPDSPSAGYGRLYLLADELLLKKDDGSFISFGSGSTTYSNAGEAGVSIILTKVLEDLPFKAINGVAPIVVSDNPTDKTVEISINDATTADKGAVLLGTAAHSSAGRVVQTNDARLTDSRNPLSHNHAGTDITTGTVDEDRLPDITDLNGYPGGTDDFLRADGTFAEPPDASGGEANTASNEGTDGEGVFIQKTVANLEFNNIAPGSSKVTVTLDTVDNDIDIDIDEAELDIASLGGTLDYSALANKPSTFTPSAHNHSGGDINSGTVDDSFLSDNVFLKTQDNELGAHYFDMERIAAPTDPSTNEGRFYVKQIDSNNDGVFAKIKKNGSFVEVQIL